jgi:MFS family permease
MHNEPSGAQESAQQAKKATASGWIGSVLEYYDFFIYATAASLIFPQLFFPRTDPKVAIVASLATYGVGYVARPIGAVVLGHWGDTHGRKQVLILCMFLMGLSTMAVGLLPTYAQVGMWAPVLLVVMRLIQGFASLPASRCRAFRSARSWRRPCSCRWRTTCLRKTSTPGAGAFRSC